MPDRTLTDADVAQIRARAEADHPIGKVILSLCDHADALLARAETAEREATKWKEQFEMTSRDCAVERAQRLAAGQREERMRKALEEARQFVNDSGPDDDPEWRANVGPLLARTDAALSEPPKEDNSRG
jgi:hypothetical protein